MQSRRILVATDGSEQGAERDLARRAERLRAGGLEVVTGRTGKQSAARAFSEVSPSGCSTSFVDHSPSFPDSLYRRAL